MENMAQVPDKQQHKEGEKWKCTRCDTLNNNTRYSCKVCGQSWDHWWKDGENDNEMEIDSVVSEDTEWARTMPHKRKSDSLIKNWEKKKESVANHVQKDVVYVNENKEKPVLKEQQNPPAYFPLDRDDGIKRVGLEGFVPSTQVDVLPV